MKIANFISALGLITLGIFLIFSSGLCVLDGTQTTRWHKVSGEIIRSEFTVVPRLTETKWNLAYPGSADTYTKPNIVFKYQVDGKIYTSSNIGLGQTKNYPEEFTHTYPLGTTVDVYYDPNSPSHACLLPGVGPCIIYFSIVGLLLFLLGTYWLFRLQRKKSKSD